MAERTSTANIISGSGVDHVTRAVLILAVVAAVIQQVAPADAASAAVAQNQQLRLAPSRQRRSTMSLREMAACDALCRLVVKGVLELIVARWAQNTLLL